MKIFIKFELDNNILNNKYRSGILSFFKNAFSSNCELYNKYYSTDKYTLKDFTFSVFLSNPNFQKEKIILEDNIIKVTISTINMSSGIDIYNALLCNKNAKYNIFNQNYITLKNIRLENHRFINQSIVCIKMLSPLVVRTHIDGKNKNLSYLEDGFTENIYKSTQYMLNEFTNIDLSTRFFEIYPINPKKTVVEAFGTKITGNLGTYKIVSDIEVINAIYQLGIGSRRSEGFGMFEIIS